MSTTRLLVAIWLTAMQTGCDKPASKTSSAAPTSQSVVESRETLTFSIDTLFDSVVAWDKRETEEARKSNAHIVGMADGKWWMEQSVVARVDYLRGMSDTVMALGRMNVVTGDARDAQKDAKHLEYAFGGDSFTAGVVAESALSGRIDLVMSGKKFGDVAEAVTKFYRDKPLLKDKPVLWILAVPLYKELEEAKPQEKRNRHFDSIQVSMVKKTQPANP